MSEPTSAEPFNDVFMEKLRALLSEEWDRRDDILRIVLEGEQVAPGIRMYTFKAEREEGGE